MKPTSNQKTSPPDIARDDAIREHDRHHERALKIADTTTQAGQLTIRTAVLVNGGAAISVLAFIGGVVGQGRINIQGIATVANSLMWFAAGIVFAVASLGSSYLAQYCTRWSIESKARIWTPPHIKATPTSERWNRMANLMRVVAIVTGILALVVFIVGMREVHDSIIHLKPPS